MNITGTNKRNFFRVNIEIPVFVRKIFYDEKKDLYYYKDWIELKSKDISGNGIFLYKNGKISFEKDDYALIKFDLTKNEDYIYILSKVVRITSDGYAFTYILFDENKIDFIISEFLKIENEKRKKSS